MKQIEAYVDEVYRNVGGNKQEIGELKAEMKNHLLEAVFELKSEGKTEYEAIELAIERFGGEKEMRSVVEQLFRAQKMFAKYVLNAAIAILLLSLALYGFVAAIETGNSSETSLVTSGALDMLNGKETISADMEKEIQQLVLGTDQITKIQVYNVRDVNKNFEGNISTFEYTRKATPAFKYDRTVWAPKLLYKSGPFEHGSREWYVAVEFKRLGSFLPLVSLVGVAVYFTLFTIWATINAYHHKRLNIGWVIVFALLNVIGYFIYLLVGNRTVKD
ncbi:permease prefix domain 1-containing protein [Planococcus sp. N028]|uniref:Permease prefix domain 1-containing protein n=1 Tax=Planococcus shixiaomingii TaxID=3058393 RepID=A0ABT8MYH5_9BACL|nr:permease prefix domain 1-containing protein [Planococcus sp. N028]MDN7240689.1 permease prefix domain 1-containing protein [Planococcus sp. N028]